MKDESEGENNTGAIERPEEWRDYVAGDEQGQQRRQEKSPGDM